MDDYIKKRLSFIPSELLLPTLSKTCSFSNLVCPIQTREKTLYMLFEGLVSFNVIILLSVQDRVTFITLDQLTLFMAVSGL